MGALLALTTAISTLPGVVVAATPPTDTAAGTTTTASSSTTSTTAPSLPTSTDVTTTTAAPELPTTTVRPRPPDPIRDAPMVLWPHAGQVAISFDDGPAPRFTGQALLILARAKVPATFFVNCSRFSRPDAVAVVKLAARAGHSVQNHTWSHPYLGSTDTPHVISELQTCSKAITALTGIRPTAFRPPYGSTSPRIESIAKRLGMTKVMWNVCPPVMILSEERLSGSVAHQIRVRAADHRQGIVILLHDGSGSAGATMSALPGIIRLLKSPHYQFVRLG